MQSISSNNPSGKHTDFLLAYYSVHWNVKPIDTGWNELSFLVGQAEGMEDDSS